MSLSEAAATIEDFLGKEPPLTGKAAAKKAKKEKEEMDSTRLVAAVTFKNGAVQFRTPKRKFIETMAGQALVIGAVTAGLVVVLAGTYYVLKASGALEFLGASPPVNMTPMID